MILIIGLGFVGNAIYQSFLKKEIEGVFVYDKYKNGGIGVFTKEIVDKCKYIYLCLPTEYSYEKKEYDKLPIIETLKKLEEYNCKSTIILKSTVEPETTKNLSKSFKNLSLVHNPEFLTAVTAEEDFHNQKHVVLGKGLNTSDEKIKELSEFYKKNYPNAEISTCNSTESESMKIFCNSFYSVKVQFFNELYLICKKNGSEYNVIKELMLKNKWINEMHTTVPGPDGKLSYGGFCFPKDTNALLDYMKSNNTPGKVLDACIEERNEMRDDHVNCQIKKD